MTEESKKRWQNRLKMALTTSGCVTIPLAPFYSAFVVQSLWNWFVTGAIHGAELAYWQSLGILIVVSVLRHRDVQTFGEEMRWERALAMMEVTVPEEKRPELEESLKKYGDSWRATLALTNPSVGRAMVNTIALVAGWVVHTFLM
jgi:hypothetical protein